MGLVVNLEDFGVIQIKFDKSFVIEKVYFKKIRLTVKLRKYFQLILFKALWI